MEVLCRLCGQIRLPEEIKCKVTDDALQIKQKLNDCCRWHLYLNHNKLPESICISCFECLERSWLFCERVAATQDKLINDLNENELKTSHLLEIKLEIDEILGEASTSEMDWDERDSMEHVELEIKAEPNVLLTSAERENENINEEIEVNIPYGDETIDSQVAQKIKFPECLSSNDCNSDGTVDDRAISKLNLCNWSLFQHQCNECDQFFIDSLRLIQHHKRHHPLSVLRFKCWLCKNDTESRSYTSRRTLHRHIVRDHIPYLAYCCKWCNRYFWDLKVLKKHSPRRNRCIRDIVSLQKVMCEQCGAEFSSENNLRSHQFSIHFKDAANYLCEICGIEYDTSSKLRQHYIRLHQPLSRIRVYECYICRVSFKCKNSLVHHMPQHTSFEKIQYECKECFLKFSRPYALRRHSLIHTNRFPFECEYCAKPFRTRTNLKVHVRIHTGERLRKAIQCPVLMPV